MLYVFRTLVDGDIPMNEGCLKPLEIVIPDGCMLNPVYPAAVVAGNVETSQWVTNALYGALGMMAAAAGHHEQPSPSATPTHQYYETIAGGSGAGPGHDGTSAIQTHMTNSRLTDPEVLEWRFPVLGGCLPNPHRFGRQRHATEAATAWSAGSSSWSRWTASILSSHRSVAPFGLDGGEPATSPGHNWVERADGKPDRTCRRRKPSTWPPATSSSSKPPAAAALVPLDGQTDCRVRWPQRARPEPRPYGCPCLRRREPETGLRGQVCLSKGVGLGGGVVHSSNINPLHSRFSAVKRVAPTV